MHKKKPVSDDKTIFEQNDQISPKKPLGKEATPESSTDSPTPLFVVPNDASPKVEAITEDELPVSLSEVLQWKKSGNYEVLEYHIRRGSLEMLPTEDVARLIRLSQEHAFMCDAARRLLAALQPLLDKEKEVSAYLDLESKFKVDFAKIIEEAAMAMMNPMGKGTMPFWTLLQSCFDASQFSGISLQPLQTILAHQGFNFKPYQEFADKLGLFPVEDKQAELEV